MLATVVPSGGQVQLSSKVLGAGTEEASWSVAPVNGLMDGNVFIEPFTWLGPHAATIGRGTGTTVWWNQDAWDTRADTAANSVASEGAGNHIDIHGGSPDPAGGSVINSFALGGGGTPGVGIMHLDFQGIMSARLRNPLLISQAAPGVVDFFATSFVTTGHWWEVAITPATGVTGGENTSLPSPGALFDGEPGPGHTPSEDSINFLSFGSNDVPCKTGWGFKIGMARTIGYSRQDFVGAIFPEDPADKDRLLHWRLVYYPDHVDAFVDLTGGSSLKLLSTFPVTVPWSEVYVHLLGVGYQADHHPQNGDCGAFQGRVRELPWKEVRIGPVKYGRTVAYPKDQGLDRVPQVPQDSRWIGYDTRDTQRFGVVNGVPQPNSGPYNVHASLAFCNGSTYGCTSPSPSRTMAFELPAQDAQGIARAQLIYDVRGGGTARLVVNGTSVGAMPGAGTVRAATPEMWTQRSIDVPPGLLRAGANTVEVSMTGNIQFDRLQIELGYADGAAPATLGTISSSGLFSAPVNVPGPITVLVQAVSVADPTKTRVVPLTIVPAPCMQVAGAPPCPGK